MRVFKDDLFRELIIDNFAGGGGASTGIELATGQPVDIAINHDENAIRMHEINHPHTIHLRNDVFAIDPVQVTGGRPVGLAWFSPDCTHFSKAKGGKPRKKEIRDLAWVVVKWAKAVKPRIIMLENVEEFKTWGPIDDNGYPIKEQSGETFNEWLSQLKGLGYDVEFKELRACDYGAPTTRKRLFIVARCDGKPIIWPAPTHGAAKGLKPYKTAADIIDWTIRGQSIFNRKKDLVTSTLRRITRGIDKFVIKNNKPFIMQYKFENQPENIDEPLRTITGVGSQSLITPIMSQLGHTGFKSDRNREIDKPLSTVVSKNEHLLVTPTLMVNNTGHSGAKINESVPTITTAQNHYLINPAIVPIGYGEAPGQAPRVNDSNEPLGTIVSSSVKHHVVSFIGKEFTGATPSDIENPLPTITQVDHNRLVSAVMSNYYGNGHNASSLDEPLRTVVAREIASLVKVHFRKVADSNIGNWYQIRNLLNLYGGYNLADDEVIIFEINGIEYIMIDIEMRMLLPKELYAAQGFPVDYNFDLDGEMTKTEQIKKCGNAVCPPLSYALAKANYEPALDVPRLETMKELYHYSQFGNLRMFRSKE